MEFCYLNAMGKLLLKVLIVIGLIYILALIGIYVIQRSFMYFPPASHPGLKSTSLTDMEIVTVKSDDGNTVPAWWQAPREDMPVIMFFHGNGSSAYDGQFIYQHFIDLGFGILGAEYPGYPGATGKPSETAIVAAALAQYDYVRAQSIKGEHIYLYGSSLGTGVAAQLAAQREVGKIVAEAPFNSMLDMAQMSMPLFAFSPLIKDHYRSDQALAGQDVPLLWLHGTADQVIPLSQGQKLYDQYDGPKEKLIIKGGDHSNLWVSGGREAITVFFKP